VNHRNEEFDTDEMLWQIQNAKTIELLDFIGQVMRVHKDQELAHTKDESFMERCRSSFSDRRQQLLREQKSGTRVRQQHVRDHQQKPKQNTGDTRRLFGEL